MNPLPLNSIISKSLSWEPDLCAIQKFANLGSLETSSA